MKGIMGKFMKNIGVAGGEDEHEEGSIDGKLDVINIHGKKSFFIYPILGAKKVQCIFTENFIDRVKKALGERVEVEGTLTYKSWDKFPYAINVKNIY